MDGAASRRSRRIEDIEGAAKEVIETRSVVESAEGSSRRRNNGTTTNLPPFSGALCFAVLLLFIIARTDLSMALRA
jgi:hypothetical protein